MTIVDKLKKKYKKQLQNSKPRKSNDFNPTIYLFQKWAYKVEKDWYGFDLGWAPFVWGQVIDEFLSYLDKECPNFTIHQIKLKFGSIRFYVDTRLNLGSPKDTKIRNLIGQLENLLSSKELIY